ncbi:MAG: D-cysteine desulfhydrase [Pseudobdellovibrionaceae bacterium]
MLLTKFPRVVLSSLPTPLEKLERVSKHLSGVNVYVKRDDLTGCGGGGNKVRKLEYLLGDAVAKGADAIITQGAVQSNHVRQTIACAAKIGLPTYAILERRVQGTNQRFDETGNVLLDHLFGVNNLRFVNAGTDMNKEMQVEASRLREQGKNPYIIPGGGSNVIGALGYVHAALELINQANEKNLRIDHVIVGSGSSGTHAGLAAGFKAFSAGINLVGISVRQPEKFQVNKVWQEAQHVSEYMQSPALSEDEIKVDSSYVGEGYGLPTKGTWDAIVLAARLEGLILDPVYTGKAFDGLLGLARQGVFKPGENVVFFHTGGNFGLFAYEEQLRRHLA